MSNPFDLVLGRKTYESSRLANPDEPGARN